MSNKISGDNQIKKVLVVYYSWSNGNTEKIANEVKNALDADIMKIETLKPYPSDYQTTVNQGQEEVRADYRPEIKSESCSPGKYDLIVIGTPTWWYTMAPAMKTFLTSHSWAGKTVIPFQTHGGWPGSVIKDIKSTCPGAVFKHEMQIQFDNTGGDRMITNQEAIDHWIEEIKQR